MWTTPTPWMCWLQCWVEGVPLAWCRIYGNSANGCLAFPPVTSLIGSRGVFSISAHLAVENLDQVEQAIAAHVAEICANPITEAELRRIQTQVSNRYVFGSETPSDRAGLYGYYHTLTGHVDNALAYPPAIQALTPADIQQAAQRYLAPSAYGLVTLRPDR
jgi:zinc protease